MENSKPRFTDPINCGHCNNKAPMEVVAAYTRVQRIEDSGFEWEEGPFWELCNCPACSKLNLREGYWHDGRDPHDLDYEYLYPSEKKSLLGLPNEVDKAYQAALKVRNVDSNAFAVLLGRVLELVCIDRKASGESLYDRLDSLAKKGEIPDKLINIAHQLRLTCPHSLYHFQS